MCQKTSKAYNSACLYSSSFDFHKNDIRIVGICVIVTPNYVKIELTPMLNRSWLTPPGMQCAIFLILKRIVMLYMFLLFRKMCFNTLEGQVIYKITVCNMCN